MKSETRDLLDRMVDHLMTEYAQEQQFLAALKDEETTEQQREEIARYLEDRIVMHPQRPESLSTSYERVMSYVDRRLRKAGWQERMDDWQLEGDLLKDELDQLQAEYLTLADDLDDDDAIDD